MAKPRRFIRVEWREKLDEHGRPSGREQHRNFEKPAAAAAQIASVQSWPERLELVGVYLSPTDWSPVDDDTLAMFMADNLSDDAAERYALLASTRGDTND